ncbi:MAG: ABC transporter substrate-binding protein [Clostridia bacterium]|nr:ABC transporter substrate-binding protein [Clostridia bacterium]
MLTTEEIEMLESANPVIIEAWEIEITDMAGRKVIIPSEIETVFGSNNNSSILLYTLAPEKMAAWNLDFSETSKKYMIPETAALPVLGNLYGSGSQANIEEIIALDPDIVLITDLKISDKLTQAADELQDKLGIPVVVVSANLKNFDKAYTFLGELLSAEEKASELAEYYRETFDEAAALSAEIEEKKTIYYAYLDNGLTTEFAGSANAELIELVGGINAAVAEAGGTSGEVTIEQILVWNPDVILVGHKGAALSKAAELIKTDGVWAEVKAVKEGNVVSVPHYPFNWFDRPPSVNRILGIKWLGNLLYPEVYNYDMYEETKEFFRLFYGCELTDEEAGELLGK